MQGKNTSIHARLEPIQSLNKVSIKSIQNQVFNQGHKIEVARRTNSQRSLSASRVMMAAACLTNALRSAIGTLMLRDYSKARVNPIERGRHDSPCVACAFAGGIKACNVD